MILEFLQRKVNQKKQTVNRMKFHTAELKKLIDDKKSGRISDEEFVIRYKIIEKQWG